MNIQHLSLWASLLWLEYEEAAEAAREELSWGNKLGALQLAISAHKIKQEYYGVLDKMIYA
jgi:hypothetical protein